MSYKGLLTLLAALVLFSSELFSQQQREAKDSLIRLVEAQSAAIQEIDGISYRQVIGNARFLHNDTYLLCDTALWNVNDNVIKAIGNVQIIQENTFLTSDRIDYIVDDNLARVRGSLVELYDKEGNILRTNYLDYNTRDSIGNFFNGGAMKGNTGNLIESNEGWYFAYEKLFTFDGNVQMFADSVFIRANQIEYNTVENKAYFGRSTVAWQEDNMLFTNDGEFDRPNNIFNFTKDSYILTADQELWADTLTYFRNTGNSELRDNIQILDTKQSAYSFSDKASCSQYPMEVTLTKNPSVALYTLENGVRDTVFLAADTIKYYHVRYCDIDSAQIAQAQSRVKLSNLDPLIEIEAASQKNRVDNRPLNNIIPPKKLSKEDDAGIGLPQKDSLEVKVDSVGVKMDSLAVKVDSLGVMADSLAVMSDSLGVMTDSLGVMSDSLGVMNDSLALQQLDTTAVTFIEAWRNVKVYRSDIQALCDSLIYTDLDSMARMYINPVMWNDVRHQFTSDSMQLVVKNGVLSKLNMLSNAFIASQEDTVHYNQIKGAEMVAYFKDNDLYRFDALGGASMIFYLREDSLITIMNQKEGKILSAKIKDREIQRIKYIESLKNDAHPVFNLPIDKQRLKDFNWRGGERPKNRFEIVDRVIKESQRESFRKRRFPNYYYSEVYFPQEREWILDYKRRSDSIRIARALAKRSEKESITADSLSDQVVADSLSVKPFRDSLDVSQDSLAVETVDNQDADKSGDEAVLKKERKRSEKRADKIRKKEERKEIKRRKREQRKLEKELRKQERLEAKNERKKRKTKQARVEDLEIK